MRLLVAFIGCAALASGEVRVWQGTLTLPTYEEAAPDPNPPFDAWATGRFNYPYTIRDRLTDRVAPHKWRAVFLENEYLKCSVLPDLGGHVYTCIDKLSGQPMFYANPSIKKADIGYRGAWAAFGIEFNFPVSHNWVSLSPVAFSYSQKPDGSASVTVGNIDRVYGMEWRVELTLRPGSTVLEEHVTIYNRSDVRHRYYWWNNAAIEVKDDSQICYPMRFTAAHGFADIDTWPVDSSGKDLSIVRDQTAGPVSRFAYGTREPFMGVWRPDTNTGTVHYAEYAELPAKKIWSWGVDADGLDWRRALSDNNSAYVEVQAGLFRDQETYAFLEPRQVVRFTEYWVPVSGIGGIARANLSGVLNLSRRNGMLAASFNATHRIEGASVRILDHQRAVYTEKLTLTPDRMWTHAVEKAAVGPYTFELVDAGGKVLLSHTEGQYEWTPAGEVHTGPQPQPTFDDPLQRGTQQELQGDLLGALKTYTSAAPPLNSPAGRLCAGLQRYAEAIRYLEGNVDPEAGYYLGLAYDGAGDSAKARQAYETAARAPEFRAAAGLKLGELLARAGDRAAAIEAFKAAGDDPRALEEVAALNGKTMIVDDPDRLLDVAAQYIRIGLYKQAVALLSRETLALPADLAEPGAVTPQQHPLIAYYRAYCRAKLGESPAADYATASKLSTLYVFPSRAEDLEVLHAAVAANPGDATAHYLLGTQLYARGMVNEALAEWNAARYSGAAVPVLHADLGRAMLYDRHDYIGAWRVFSEGLKIDPLNSALWEGVDATLTLMGRPARELATALAAYPDMPHMPVQLVYALAFDLAEAQDFDGARALLRDRFLVSEEGGTNVREVWVEINLMQALVNAAADKCETALPAIDGLGAQVPGFPFTADGLQPFINASRTQYLLGQIDLRCGRESKAKDRWRRVVEATGYADLVWAWGAARRLDGYDRGAWIKRIEAVSSRAGSAQPYAAATLQAILGKQAAAWSLYQQALIEPDRQMSHHLTRLAMTGRGLPQ